MGIAKETERALNVNENGKEVKMRRPVLI